MAVTDAPKLAHHARVGLAKTSFEPEARSPHRDEAVLAEAADGLDSIGEERWESLVPPGSSPLSYTYLRAFEQVRLDGLRSRPIVAFEPGKPDPIASCPGYWYDLDLVSTRAPSLAGLMSRLRRVRPRLLKARTLELGTPAPLTNPFMVRPGVDRDLALEAISKAGMAEARGGKASFVLVQNLARNDLSAIEKFGAFGFVTIPLLPTVVVTLGHDSFEDYLGAMRSQYRRRARLTLERSGDLTVEHRRDFAGMAGELAQLWRSIYDRAKELRREVLTPEYFSTIAALDTSSVLLLRRPDASVAAFALLIEDHPFLTFLQCGFRAEAGKDEGAYFRLLYEIVRYGIENRFRHAELGMTTVQPKLDIGGVPVPLYGLIRHSNPVLHRVMAHLATGPLAPKTVEARNVFKKPPPGAEEIVAERFSWAA